jgi:hypothetical protein
LGSTDRSGRRRAKLIEVVAGLFEAPSKQPSLVAGRPLLAKIFRDPRNHALDEGDGIQINNVCLVTAWKLVAGSNAAESLELLATDCLVDDLGVA